VASTQQGRRFPTGAAIDHHSSTSFIPSSPTSCRVALASDNGLPPRLPPRPGRKPTARSQGKRKPSSTSPSAAHEQRHRRNVVGTERKLAGDELPERPRTAGFHVQQMRTNDYDFISDRAVVPCSTYGVESISLAG
jgi:hypothetical protein